jgi:hypothetical protein
MAFFAQSLFCGNAGYFFRGPVKAEQVHLRVNRKDPFGYGIKNQLGKI